MNVYSLASRGVLLTLLALAGCSGSDRGGPPLAGVPEGVPAPCLAAFEAVSSSDAGQGAAAMASAIGEVVPLSSCTFDADRNVRIGGDGGCGPVVVIDRSFAGQSALGNIAIAANGKLAAPETIPGGLLEIETAGITVDGLLSIGTAVCPVGGKDDPTGRVKVTFTGAQGSANPDPERFAGKGIEVRKGGVLRLHGAKGVPSRGDGISWTHLRRPAGPAAYQRTDQGIGAPVDAGGERTLYLATDVGKGDGGGWQAGDWIVVATSSFSPFESEFVQIASVGATAGGSVLTLRQPLRHYHFGGADPGLPSEANYGADASKNFGVDERSEVGLISRNITFTARTTSTTRTDPKNPDQNHHWGGEIRIAEGFAEASVQGVELEKFGKARLGSYPIHFHMTGKAGPHLIDSNSIHHSYNKCVTVHMSQGVSVSHNVCARAVGHLFYQEMGGEQGGRFIGNLGLGAMSHHFGLDDSVPRTNDGLVQNWWEGDNLAQVNGYDGLNVPNTDRQSNPTHGRCFRPDPNRPGVLMNAGDTPCLGDLMYVEQASGFWLVNPGTVLEGNAIGGCQGMGKGYWYVPPQDLNGVQYLQKFEPVGSFRNNRVHACYDGLFGETDVAAVSDQLFPTVDGKPTSAIDSVNLIAHFDGLTATRMRNRGVWMRPVWTAVENGRFATNRDAVSLVSSGGNDGNAPGVWALLKDSVLVGLSINNVDRWGPCPRKDLGEGPGCVDLNPKANEVAEKGYQTPGWNSAGYMIYDGPVRIIRNHFVNYLKDITPLLTAADRETLAAFDAWPRPAAKVYEGDAALGWFQNNQSAYPTASVSRALSFDNVDLRHQIYTEKVNFGDFRDGDMNTALIDLDGTLTGYRVVDQNGAPVPGEFPISLNNLPFNRVANAVDECLATGQQDALLEGRPTSLISPANMATLEFEAQYPLEGPQRKTTWQNMVFMKDSLDHGTRQSMSLLSRNGQGIWEPKVASGAGYTVRTAPSTAPRDDAVNPWPSPTGMPATVRVGFTDAVKPAMDKKPFHVRLGICYANAQGGSPNGNFKISRGYKSWGGNGVSRNNPALFPYFNYLENKRPGQSCFNLDHQNAQNLVPGTGCPAEGVMPVPASGCPAGSTEDGGLCVFPRAELQPAASIAELTQPDGTPAGLDKYFFDAKTGMLFFYVQQDSPNARGGSPLGSCRGQPDDDPACPGAGELETYYSCPPQGCINYSVVLNDPNYTPGPSNCDQRAGGSIYGADGTGGYTLPEPLITNRLAYVGESGAGAIVQAVPRLSDKGFLHWEPARPPSCAKTTAPVPAGPPTRVGALQDGAVSGPLPWRRRGLDIAAAAKMRGFLSEWFSAPRSPVADIGALTQTQICSATPG